MAETIELARLPDAARERYLRYAMSVITSRALPDVRDGLKPVQRRILYAMQADLALGGGETKHKKSAEVVGAVMGSYHPHGDQAIYEAMARMAQPFSLRYPLVDGQGNFGAISGDPPAHMRYTESRLRAISSELMTLLGEETVEWKPNYSQTTTEPIVLPATAPFLLVNGSTGIAVGMATNIPAHNLSEVVSASVLLVENPDATNAQLLRVLKGPDFPTGGEILTTRDELKAIYETGKGSMKLRGTYEIEEGARGSRYLVITSLPYGTTVEPLFTAIKEIVRERRVPHAIDVRDDSDDKTPETAVRLSIELKKEADPHELAAYLFKHTPLQVNYGVNMTCLVPTENPLVGRPEVLDLRGMLRHFLDFRFLVVTKSLEFRLARIEERIHILNGFVTVLKGLDVAIKLIRAARDKEDAQKKLMSRFKIDAAQADAVLELRLWKLSQLEVEKLRDELKEKKDAARTIERQLKGTKPRWKLIRDDLVAFEKKHGDARRTKILLSGDREHEYDAEAYIAKEDTNVVVTRIGLVKRVRSLKDPSETRVREDDSVGWLLQGSTRAECVFFSSFGSAYTAKLVDAPATTGYGDPVQKLFKFGDGERLVAALSLDPRVTPEKEAAPPAARTVGKAAKKKKGKGKSKKGESEEVAPPPYMLVVTAHGHVLRAPLAPLREVSTRAGRRFARTGEGDEVVACELIPPGSKTGVVATLKGYALRFPLAEVPVLAGVGKGPRAIKLEKGDRVVAATVRPVFRLETTRGTEEKIVQKDLEQKERGSIGVILKQRGGYVREIAPPPLLQELEPEKGE